MKPDARYEYLLWDVDGTLLDFEYSMRVSLSMSLEKIGVAVTEELIDQYSQINDKWWKRLERGEVTREQLLPGRFLELFEACKIQCHDFPAYLADFQRNLSCQYRLMKGAQEVCRTLKEQGIHQFVVTNGVTVTQKNKLRLSKLADSMEEIFVSQEVGAAKPRKEFFDVCFEQIAEKYPAFDKAKALIIGDSLSSDIKGGQNAGIDTCLFKTPKQEIPEKKTPETAGIVPTWEIDSLEEVLELVRTKDGRNV